MDAARCTAALPRPGRPQPASGAAARRNGLAPPRGRRLRAAARGAASVLAAGRVVLEVDEVLLQVGAQARHEARFELAHPLPRDAELVPQLLQRLRLLCQDALLHDASR